MGAAVLETSLFPGDGTGKSEARESVLQASIILLLNSKACLTFQEILTTLRGGERRVNDLYLMRTRGCVPTTMRPPVFSRIPMLVKTPDSDEILSSKVFCINRDFVIRSPTINRLVGESIPRKSRESLRETMQYMSSRGSI